LLRALPNPFPKGDFLILKAPLALNQTSLKKFNFCSKESLFGKEVVKKLHGL
jgi:hypothetical protein